MHYSPLYLYYLFFAKPATSEYIVKDTGNSSPRYMRCTINQVKHLLASLIEVFSANILFSPVIQILNIKHHLVWLCPQGCDFLFVWLDSLYCRSSIYICNAVGFVGSAFSSPASIRGAHPCNVKYSISCSFCSYDSTTC